MRQNRHDAKTALPEARQARPPRLTLQVGQAMGMNVHSDDSEPRMTALPRIRPAGPSPAPLPAAPTAAAIDERGAAILDRIRKAFAEKGFDGASMQDLARAAGMSAGNFYRYFPSKLAILEALIAQDAERAEADFARLAGAADQRAALRDGFARRLAEDHRENGPLWAEISAAALRKSDITPACNRLGEVVGCRLNAVFARLTGLDETACAERFGAHGRFLMLLVKAAALRGPERDDPQLQALILDTIDRLLDDIANRAAGG